LALGQLLYYRDSQNGCSVENFWAGGQIPANPTWPSLHLTWEYVAWALVQEFMLQSFFFTRCEGLIGVR